MTPFKDPDIYNHHLLNCCRSDERERGAGESAASRLFRGCCCAPCLAGQTQAILKSNDPDPHPNLFLQWNSACYGWLCAQGIAAIVDATGLLMACVPAVVTGAWQAGEVRDERREKSRSWGTCAGDCVTGYCCSCCLNIKNYRDAKALAQKDTTLEHSRLKGGEHASNTLPPVIAEPEGLLY